VLTAIPGPPWTEAAKAVFRNRIYGDYLALPIEA
jgi:hypothetical protein